MITLGEWRFDSALGELSRGAETVRLEMRTVRLLDHLIAHAGEVVSIEQLLDTVWAGVIVTPDSVYQAVTSLRRALGDDPKRPTYIATVPKLGYRLVASIENDSAAAAIPPPRKIGRRPLMLAGGLAVALLVAGYRVFPSIAISPVSIAVMPFLDMTQAMDEEPFADGMTEELIDKFSKVPHLRVAPLSASFAFKEKEVTPPEAAKALGVTYLVEGSVRKSEGMLRVTAQLIRADRNYLLWSETYDRPVADILAIQDSIATEVRKALEKSLPPGS